MFTSCHKRQTLFALRNEPSQKKLEEMKVVYAESAFSDHAPFATFHPDAVEIPTPSSACHAQFPSTGHFCRQSHIFVSHVSSSELQIHLSKTTQSLLQKYLEYNEWTFCGYITMGNLYILIYFILLFQKVVFFRNMIMITIQKCIMIQIIIRF